MCEKNGDKTPDTSVRMIAAGKGNKTFVVFQREHHSHETGTKMRGEMLPDGSSVIETWTWREDRWHRFAFHRYGRLTFSSTADGEWRAESSNALCDPIAKAILTRLQGLGLAGPVETVEATDTAGDFVVFHHEASGNEIDWRLGNQMLPAGSTLLEAWIWDGEHWNRLSLYPNFNLLFERSTDGEWTATVGETGLSFRHEIANTVLQALREIRSHTGEDR